MAEMADIDHDAPDHDQAYCSTCDNRPREVNEGAIEMYVDLLTLHGFRAGWLAQDVGTSFMGTDARGVRMGRWNCACGAGGPLDLGERIQGAHRQHLAEVLEHYLGFIVQAAQEQMLTGIVPGID